MRHNLPFSGSYVLLPPLKPKPFEESSALDLPRLGADWRGAGAGDGADLALLPPMLAAMLAASEFSRGAELASRVVEPLSREGALASRVAEPVSRDAGWAVVVDEALFASVVAAVEVLGEVCVLGRLERDE